MKYLIYKGTGGLIHMLCGLIHCITWAIKNKHILIIDVISHKCFQHYLSDFFILQETGSLRYSEDYNIVETGIKFRRLHMDYIKNYKNIEVDRGLGNNTHIYLLNNIKLRVSLDGYDMNDKVKMYAGPGCNSYINLIKFIKVKSDILDIIKKYDNDNILDNKYMGVHFRNTDIKNDINIVIDTINKSSYKNIYLATDDSMAFELIKSKCSNYNIIQFTKPINANGKPIHYADDNKYSLILNTLIDIYYLYKADIFIPNISSSVSRLINYMRENKKSIFD
jgi:hypothetical protein